MAGRLRSASAVCWEPRPEKAGLQQVTLVLNDWGGAQIPLAEGRTERIARVVLTACEAFDNYPPGLPGRAIQMVTRTPGGIYATMRLPRSAVRLQPGREAVSH
ncbi:MAG TPA: hypothetical protein VN969_26475 [Streptosporangiaceae bacterium]|jgi:hypothetical protein|nr:hypothetical protein [Streptosporangiaceae bacterium]